MAIAPAAKNTISGLVTTSAVPVVGAGVRPEAEQEEEGDGHARDDRHRGEVDAVEQLPGDPDRSDDEAEEQATHDDGLVVEESFENRRKRRDREQDAAEQRHQPEPLDRSDRLPGLGELAREDQAERVGPRADVADQSVVDPEHERDGSPGNARHDVGGTHRESTGDLREVVERGASGFRHGW